MATTSVSAKPQTTNNDQITLEISTSPTKQNDVSNQREPILNEKQNVKITGGSDNIKVIHINTLPNQGDTTHSIPGPYSDSNT
jgi:hypothetical protein